MIYGAARVAPEKAVIRPALPMSFLPGVSEMQMAKMNYSEQLKNPNWQKRRLEALNEAGWSCRKCDATDATLHVHHKQYFKGRMAWEYESEDLEVLCESCHASEHDHQDLLKRLLSNARILGVMREKEPLAVAIGLIGGYFHGHFAGQLDEELAMQAEEAAPVSFNRGLMLAGLTGTVRVWDMAQLIREGHMQTGQPLTDAVEKLLTSWEALRTPDEGGIAA